MEPAGRSEVGVVPFCRLKTTDRTFRRSCDLVLRGSPRMHHSPLLRAGAAIATTDRQLLALPKLTCHLPASKKMAFHLLAESFPQSHPSFGESAAHQRAS